MAVTTTTAPVELTDELAPTFLEELERSGVRKAARATGVEKRLAYDRRRTDRAFREAWETARQTRLRTASDQLMAAIDEMVSLHHGGWEYAIDEMVNVAFDVTAEPPARTGIIPEELAQELADVRQRLRTAAEAWAVRVAEVTR